MSNKLIADLMSFRARMVADNRTQLMFEGDFDTIDQAIATLRKATITSPQQVSQSEPVGYIAPEDYKNLAEFGSAHCLIRMKHREIDVALYAAGQQAIPSGYVAVPIQLLNDVRNCFDNVPHRAHVRDNVDANLKRIAQWVNASEGGYGLYDQINTVLSASPTAPIERDK
jgi:hypothetical protein